MSWTCSRRNDSTDELWNLAKQGAFMCFLVACALLGASLVLSGNLAAIGNGQAHLARSGATCALTDGIYGF